MSLTHFSTLTFDVIGAPHAHNAITCSGAQVSSRMDAVTCSMLNVIVPFHCLPMQVHSSISRREFWNGCARG